MQDDEAELRQLVDEAVATPLRGWDFSALAGRAVSQALPWDYVELARAAAARAARVLDVDTGGGEVLAALTPPTGSIAVEPFPPNVPVATARLRPLGVEVRPRGGPRLPVEDGEVDLVLDRHGAFHPVELARVLSGGGTLVSQQVGHRNDVEINDALGVPLVDDDALVSPEATVARLTAAGFAVERCEESWPTTAYRDVGALVLQLRAVTWQVAGFDPAAHLDGLRRVHRHIREHGSFVVTSHRLLVVARRT